MIRAAVVTWIVGLATVVPYATYYLLFHAQRDQYALLITLVLFWIFGFWGVVGPILTGVKVRSVFRAIEQAHAQGRLVEALSSEETREVAIDIVATENGIPRFLAGRICRILATRLADVRKVRDTPVSAGPNV
jgi:hypothetical protein